jgi:hypothetical protein
MLTKRRIDSSLAAVGLMRTTGLSAMRRLPWRRVAIGWLLVAVVAGCGDEPRYRLMVENSSPGTLVVVLDGTAYGTVYGESSSTAFRLAGAGAISLTGYVAPPLSEAGRWAPRVTFLGPDCRVLAEFDVELGTSGFRIDAQGGVRRDSGLQPAGEEPEASPMGSGCIP